MITCLNTAALYLFLSSISLDIQTFEDNKVIIYADEQTIVWQSIGNDLWTVSGVDSCKSERTFN